MSATATTAAALLQVIARPGDLHPLDQYNPATGCGVWMRATLAEILQANPGARVMTWQEWEPMAIAAEVAQHCQPAKEVDAQRWWDLLECMFPLNWHGTGGAAESFMLAEPYTDTLRVCMVRIGDRYAEMIRPRTTTHSQLCDEARALFSAAAPQS